jgi:3-methyladenine DNA glycosylase AlkC
MAPKLKDFFDEGIVRSIATDIQAAHPRFDAGSFIETSLSGLTKLELTARGAHVAEAMRKHLPHDFEVAARILIDSLGPELDRSDEFGLAPLRYMPHVFFVARHGLDHFESSMRAQYEVTKRFSAESSIRAFLVRHPEATYQRLVAWARDANVHVRRLVSEGTRPRLPWAPRLRAFQKDPAPVLRLLEMLKDDAERYVQRSVANNLNDIGKDHPELLVDTCARWMAKPTEGRRWIVGHALRSVVKRGDRGALRILGVAGKPDVRVEVVRFEPRRVRLGSTLRFSFELVSSAKREQELLVDYAVHFVKANGETRPKVFKLRKLVLPSGGRARLEGRVSFAPMTTRTHRPGRHAVELQLNGVAIPLGEFEVVTDPS